MSTKRNIRPDCFNQVIPKISPSKLLGASIYARMIIFSIIYFLNKDIQMLSIHASQLLVQTGHFQKTCQTIISILLQDNQKPYVRGSELVTVKRWLEQSRSIQVTRKGESRGRSQLASRIGHREIMQRQSRVIRGQKSAPPHNISSLRYKRNISDTKMQ